MTDCDIEIHSDELMALSNRCFELSDDLAIHGLIYSFPTDWGHVDMTLAYQHFLEGLAHRVLEHQGWTEKTGVAVKKTLRSAQRCDEEVDDQLRKLEKLLSGWG